MRHLLNRCELNNRLTGESRILKSLEKKIRMFQKPKSISLTGETDVTIGDSMKGWMVLDAKRYMLTILYSYVSTDYGFRG